MDVPTEILLAKAQLFVCVHEEEGARGLELAALLVLLCKGAG